MAHECLTAAPALLAEAAELRAMIAGLRREADELATSFRTLANAVTAAENVAGIMLGARGAGYREALAERDDYEAAARAQLARAGFRVIQNAPVSESQPRKEPSNP